METSDPNSANLASDEDGMTLEFEAVRGVASGAKLRLTCSHWLQFDEMPAELTADRNASRAHAVVILPQYATNDIHPPGARFECRDFLTLRDLRAFEKWLHATFSSYKGSKSGRIDAEFVLTGSNRSVELCFRSESAGTSLKSSVIGRLPQLQRDDWKSHWKWMTESPRDGFAFVCDFAFFFDSECLGKAASELGNYLRAHED